MLATYRPVFALPGAKALLGWSLLTRSISIPQSAILLIAAYGAAGSWLWASVAAALGCLTAAISSWYMGSLMDRFPPRRVPLLTAPGALTLCGLGLFADSPLTACLWAAAAGLTRPGSGTALRTVWTWLCEEQKTRAAAYSLEAGMVPFAGAAGAAAAGLVAAAWSPGAVAVLAGAGLFLSTIGLGRSEAVRDAPPVQMPERSGKPLGGAAWVALIATGTSWFALSACQVGLGDALGDASLGYLTALSMIAVAGGAHTYAARGAGRDPLRWVAGGLALAALALLLLVGAVTLLIPAAILMMALGVGRGVLSPSVSSSIARWVPQDRQSEAMGLYGTAVLLGAGAGAPLAGLLTQYGAGAPMLLGATASGIAAALVFRQARREENRGAM